MGESQMKRERYFCESCNCWYELTILSKEEAEEAIRKGYPVGPPRCPRGHVLYRAA